MCLSGTGPPFIAAFVCVVSSSEQDHLCWMHVLTVTFLEGVVLLNLAEGLETLVYRRHKSDVFHPPVQLDALHSPMLRAKYNYSASASPRSHIVFYLQPLEVGYNYYIVRAKGLQHAVCSWSK